MTTVFIGGSRHISKLSADVKGRLDSIADQNLSVLVGDANGADKAVQRYLADKSFANVTVYCMGGHCRNNLGGWPSRELDAPKHARGFDFFSIKDRAMADAATHGLMLWDGESKGTLSNIARLVSQDKSVVVYLGPTKSLERVRTAADLRNLVGKAGAKAERLLDDLQGHPTLPIAEKEKARGADPQLLAKHAWLIADAEILFKLAFGFSATRPQMRYLDTFASYATSAGGDELKLTAKQEERGASLFEHAATYLLATQVDAALAELVGQGTKDDETLDAARSIARLIRNAFTHNPFAPVWLIDRRATRTRFLVQGVMSLDTEGLNGRGVRWKDFGGPLALLRLAEAVRQRLPNTPQEVGSGVPQVPGGDEAGMNTTDSTDKIAFDWRCSAGHFARSVLDREELRASLRDGNVQVYCYECHSNRLLPQEQHENLRKYVDGEVA